MWESKEKINRALGPAAVSGSGRSNFAAMDKGSFFIKKADYSLLLNLLWNCIAKKDYRLGLVPTLADKAIFFADIDHMYGLSLSAVLETIAIKLGACITTSTQQQLLESLHVTKHQSHERYHIYGVEKKKKKGERKNVWKAVNENLGFDIIDLNANTLRFDGFLKCRDGNWIPESRYLPLLSGLELKQFNWRAFYEKTWLTPRKAVKVLFRGSNSNSNSHSLNDSVVDESMTMAYTGNDNTCGRELYSAMNAEDEEDILIQVF